MTAYVVTYTPRPSAPIGAWMITGRVVGPFDTAEEARSSIPTTLGGTWLAEVHKLMKPSAI